jgi:hypothetical protein
MRLTIIIAPLLNEAVGAFRLRQPFDMRFPPLAKLGNRPTRGTNRGTFLLPVSVFPRSARKNGNE